MRLCNKCREVELYKKNQYMCKPCLSQYKKEKWAQNNRNPLRHICPVCNKVRTLKSICVRCDRKNNIEIKKPCSVCHNIQTTNNVCHKCIKEEKFRKHMILVAEKEHIQGLKFEKVYEFMKDLEARNYMIYGKDEYSLFIYKLVHNWCILNNETDQKNYNLDPITQQIDYMMGDLLDWYNGIKSKNQRI